MRSIVWLETQKRGTCGPKITRPLHGPDRCSAFRITVLPEIDYFNYDSKI